MTEFHRLTPGQLADLAAGVHSSHTLRTLRDAQLSRHLLLLSHLFESAPDDAALAMIDAARAHRPEAAAAVLAEPMVGAWLARAVQRSGKATAPPEPHGIAALAVATSARAGLDVELRLRTQGDAVMIPTMGVLVGVGEGRQVDVRVRSGRLSFTGGGAWLGLRRLTWGVEPEAAVIVDDVDPSRDIFHDEPHDRLDDALIGRWNLLFSGASRLLLRHAGDRMAESKAVLRTIIPLRTVESQIFRSVTARHAFGAFAATMPRSAPEMALTIVHEVQHSKANAFLQIEPLFDHADRGRYFAPWRADARPIWGLFHGAYAFLAVADVLNRLRAVPDEATAAEKEFAGLRLQLRSGLETLADAPSLTPSGRTFVAGMQDRFSALEAVAVSPGTLRSAARTFDTLRAEWQERNGRAN